MSVLIGHMLPECIHIEDEAMYGLSRSGNIVTEFPTGPRLSRAWTEYNTNEITTNFTTLVQGNDYLEEYETFMHHIGMNGVPFWIADPLSRAHNFVIGQVMGSGSTYILPFDDTTGLRILSNGMLEYATWNYRTHPAANLLTDMQANAVGGTTGMEPTDSSIASVKSPARDGVTAFLTNTGSSTPDIGLETTVLGRPVITGSREYTFQASFLSFDDNYNYEIRGRFFDDSDVQTGSDVFATSTGNDQGNWVDLRVSGTSPADATSAHIKATLLTSSWNPVSIGCLGISPGDNEIWFLPSTSPPLVEFHTTPPEVGARFVFSVDDAHRYFRVAMTRDSQSAQMRLLGDAYISRVGLTEVMFT